MHSIEYESYYRKSSDPARRQKIDVHATPEEIAQLVDQGYLIRERMFEGASLDRLRVALDRLEEEETRNRPPGKGGRSWGFIPRHLMDKDPAFLELLSFQPVLSIAKALMGPLVRLRGLSARISQPGEVVHEVPWHQHLRTVSKPLPPWFSRPHALDALIYLDALDDDTGPVCIVPGSHNWLDRDPAPEVYEPIEGELEVRAPAGTVVMIHSNLWHRALPTVNKKRRMLILGYTPTWLRRSPHGGEPPEDGLTRAVRDGEDEEGRILLGIGGYS